MLTTGLKLALTSIWLHVYFVRDTSIYQNNAWKVYMYLTCLATTIVCKEDTFICKHALFMWLRFYMYNICKPFPLIQFASSLRKKKELYKQCSGCKV